MKTRKKPLVRLILLGISASTLASADPSASAGQPPGKPPGLEAKAARADAKADKGEKRGDGPHGPGMGPHGGPGAPGRDGHGPGMGPHGGGMSGRAMGPHGGGMGPHAGAGGMGAHHRMVRFGPGYRGRLHQLIQEDLKDGKLDKKQLEEHVQKLREERDERRKAHREYMKERWGSLLAEPPVRQELRHHSRRVAFLNRALFVAQTDAKVKDRDKVVTRIEKLLELENERHERAMARLKSTPVPPGSALARGPAVAAPSATVEQKGDAK